MHAHKINRCAHAQFVQEQKALTDSAIAQQGEQLNEKNMKEGAHPEQNHTSPKVTSEMVFDLVPGLDATMV